MKLNKISLIKRKIKFWEKCILSINQRLEMSKDGVEEIDNMIKTPPIIANIQIKIDLICQLKLLKRCEYLLKQYQIDYEKKKIFIQYWNKWKGKYLELTDSRTSEEIDEGWNNFWNQIKGEREPKIELG